MLDAKLRFFTLHERILCFLDDGFEWMHAVVSDGVIWEIEFVQLYQGHTFRLESILERDTSVLIPILMELRLRILLFLLFFLMKSSLNAIALSSGWMYTRSGLAHVVAARIV